MPVGTQSEDNQPTKPVYTADRDPILIELGYDSTLAELVLCNDTSVRLHNCIVHGSDLAQLTIREYLSGPEAAFTRSLKTPNLGKKTAIELRKLVEAFALGRTNRVYQARNLPEERDERIPAVEARDVILAILRQFKFPDAPLQLDIGERLRNVLKEFAKCQREGQEPGVLFLTVADVVERWREAARALLGFKNLGRKSLDELKCAIDELLQRRLAKLIPDDRLPPAMKLDDVIRDFDPRFAEALLDIYPTLSHEIISPSDPQFVIEGEVDVREQIADIISSIPKKEKDVLFRRFGLQGHGTRTLEEIGNEFYVTRERVRQVEAKAIKRLRVGTRRAVFKHLLDLDANTLWDALSLGSELLLPEDLEQRHRDIEPVQQLAITVVCDDLGKWVTESGAPLGAGWIRTDRPVEAVRAMMAAVGDHLRYLPLPRSVGGIAEDLDIPFEDVALAIRAGGSFHVFEDYVVSGTVGAQARRTVRFHKVFLEEQDENLLDFTVPLATYRTRYPEDGGGPRIFDLQMRGAPHLFAPIFDSVWLPLPDQGVAVRSRGVVRYNTDRPALVQESDHDTIGHWLVGKLRELGPSRAVDLRDHATAEFGPAILPSSIQAVLVMEPTFIRLAPGVFGLQEHVAALSAEEAVFPDSIFSLPSCRYYIMARRAGEPMNLYPGWNYGFEAQLCRWSKLHSPNEVFRSLLHVAAPENWQILCAERAAWIRTKDIYGVYELNRLDACISEAKPPTAGDILAAVAVLGTLGGLSWISVNRTSHRRLDSTHAVAALALLVALNAIKPTDHWQERHLPEAEHAAVFARMASEWGHVDAPRWDRGNLRALLEDARAGLKRRPLGWVDQNEVRALIDGLLQSAPSTSSAFEPFEPDEILGPDWADHFHE
jgi:hypothetical protein